MTITATKQLKEEKDNPKNVLIVLDGTGDSRFMWSKDNPDEINAAKETFEKLTAKGFQAYKVKDDGGKGEMMRTFDSTAERVIMTPRMVGG